MADPENPSFLYRFRSADALLGKYQELEKHEIYLAAPEELNDPMEGYKDVFWYGDEVLWRNLFRQHLLCLLHSTVSCLMTSDDDWQEPIVCA